MRLELHDNVVGNSLYGQVNDVENLEEARAWVEQTWYQFLRVRRWLLLTDDDEIVERWERPVGSTEKPRPTLCDHQPAQSITRVARHGFVRYIDADQVLA